MKIVSIIICSIYISLNFLFAQNTIQNAINNFCSDEVFEYASISIEVVNLKTNKTIAFHNPNKSLPSASTAKLFSTATALEILGPNFKPRTRIYKEGYIDSTGKLIGNIWIRGGGDPSLGSKYFVSKSNKKQFLHKWKDEIKQLGINTISGSIISDASEFGYKGAPDGWNWSDLGNYYGAGPSGLTIFDNILNFKFNTSNRVNVPVTLSSIEPYSPGLEFFSYINSSNRKGDNVYFYSAPYSNIIFASGTLPINRKDFLVKASLPNPEIQFAYEFEKILENNNISVLSDYKSSRFSIENTASDKIYNDKNLIYTHQGESLINIINYTNRNSVNLFAEHLITLIGYEKNKNGSTNNGVKRMNEFWSSKFSTKGLYLKDGSGLSRSNAISAKHLTRLLIYMNTSKYNSEYKSSLPITGVNGTLKYTCKNQAAHNRIRAKSGSMSRIKSYAGYINSKTGKEYAFALIINNHTCNSKLLKQKIEFLFNILATN